MSNKNIIVFKNITTGFMNLEYINYLADIFSKKTFLKDKFTFILQKDVSNESNQAIMQMYNKLMGFNIFAAAFSKGELLEYKELNELQLRRKIEAKNIDLTEFLENEYKDYKIKLHVIEDNVYQNILSIIKEEL